VTDVDPRVSEHEWRLRSLEADRDHGVYVRRDVYDIAHQTLVDADAVQDARLDELVQARIGDARRNLAVLLGAVFAVIGTIAASLILRGLGS